ncbi:MAG: restriction endonuclease [Chloroflexota bacterium]
MEFLIIAIIAIIIFLEVPILLALLIVIGAFMDAFGLNKKRHKQVMNHQIDIMSGIDFEEYLKILLTHKGYKVTGTPVSGDLGVDLVASRNGEVFSIQVKRYDTKVSRRAVSDAVAGIDYYDCDKAMVITNNYFSPGAKALADSNGCILIDRDILEEWIKEYQLSISNNRLARSNVKPPNAIARLYFENKTVIIIIISTLIIFLGLCFFIGLINGFSNL